MPKLTPEFAQNLINSIPGRSQAFIDSKGGITEKLLSLLINHVKIIKMKIAIGLKSYVNTFENNKMYVNNFYNL